MKLNFELYCYTKIKSIVGFIAVLITGRVYITESIVGCWIYRLLITGLVKLNFKLYCYTKIESIIGFIAVLITERVYIIESIVGCWIFCFIYRWFQLLKLTFELYFYLPRT